MKLLWPWKTGDDLDDLEMTGERERERQRERETKCLCRVITTWRIRRYSEHSKWRELLFRFPANQSRRGRENTVEMCGVETCTAESSGFALIDVEECVLCGDEYTGLLFWR